MPALARTRLRLLFRLFLVLTVVWIAGPQGLLPVLGNAPWLASAAGPMSYLYDAAGRLTGAVNTTGSAATYNYDSVGNVVSISQHPAWLVKVISTSVVRGPVGTPVVIYGTGFSPTPGQNTVTFNGTAATVTAATTTSLETTAPAGATSGPIAVTSPNGSDTSPFSFTVVPGTRGAPTIASISPLIGAGPTATAPGTTVTITGTNFETGDFSEKKATFNGTYSQITAATATSITITVPPVTGSGHVAVLTPAGQAVSSQDFFVAPAGYTVSQVQATGRLAIGGSQPVAITADGKIGLIVFDGTRGQRLVAQVNSGYTKIKVLGPDGEPLPTTSSLGTSGRLVDPFTLPVNGTYTLLLDPDVGSDSFAVSLAAAPADVAQTLGIDGPAVTVSLPTAGQKAALTFLNPTAGQKVKVRLTGVGIGTATNGGTLVTLRDPAGSPLIWWGPSAPDPSYWVPYSEFAVGTSGYTSAPITLGIGGSVAYTLVVDPDGANTGSVTVQLESDTGPSTLTPPPYLGELTFTGPRSPSPSRRAGRLARAT